MGLYKRLAIILVISECTLLLGRPRDNLRLKTLVIDGIERWVIMAQLLSKVRVSQSNERVMINILTHNIG